MPSLLDLAKSFFMDKIPKDAIAIDFTMGNGYDTEYLCSIVPKGIVYAFDIQKEALQNTSEKIKNSPYSNAKLILDNHINFKDYIEKPFHAGMFNLGYRPGGDKSIHTMSDNTLIAVSRAISNIALGGILVISVYPGHEEGKKEGLLLQEMLSSLDKKHFSVIHLHMLNSSDAPYILAIERYNK